MYTQTEKHRLTNGSLEAIGLNNIFGHREDESVRHEPSVAAKLGKRIQQPDRIFGLRQTRNIQNLLHDTRKFEQELSPEVNSRQLHEELGPSPLDQPLCQLGDELLYPFLVLEAKSGTSDSDWYSIQLQTAFPIRTFLETQRRLHKATMPHSNSHTSSTHLVWFLANRGEDWRLSVAYVAEPDTAGQLDYVILPSSYHLLPCVSDLSSRR